MQSYTTILSELNQDLQDSILKPHSIIQVNFNAGLGYWYYSDATMQRDFLSAKKDLDEGVLDFPVFEKIQAIYEDYRSKKDSLIELTVEEAITQLKGKLNNE